MRSANERSTEKVERTELQVSRLLVRRAEVRRDLRVNAEVVEFDAQFLQDALLLS